MAIWDWHKVIGTRVSVLAHSSRLRPLLGGHLCDATKQAAPLLFKLSFSRLLNSNAYRQIKVAVASIGYFSLSAKTVLTFLMFVSSTLVVFRHCHWKKVKFNSSEIHLANINLPTL